MANIYLFFFLSSLKNALLKQGRTTSDENKRTARDTRAPDEHMKREGGRGFICFPSSDGQIAVLNQKAFSSFLCTKIMQLVV